MRRNYAYLKKNNIHTELYEILEDEELFMQKKEDKDKIIYQIYKYFKNNKNIEISDYFNNNTELVETILHNIHQETNNDNLQGNTLLSFADDNYMYEIVYMEDLINKNKSDNDFNQFACISNIEVLPIYGSCGIIKTSYKKGILEECDIDKEDILKIMMKNFYHIGVIIEDNGNMTEVEFAGEFPQQYIGGNFIQKNIINLLGFKIIYYIEETNNINKVFSNILGQEITGRIFMTILCPISHQKFWSLSKETINNIIEVLKDNKIVEKINYEGEQNNKMLNPFYVLKKNMYCHKI